MRSVNLVGLHLLLTYQCLFECDHCFVWGSPFQSGTMTLEAIRSILDQAEELGTVQSIYFEGGEPFLYYPIMLKGVQLASERGFQIGIVTNSYWATSEQDAVEWLKPLKGLIQDLSISSDLYHYDEDLSQQARNARAAAERLGLPIGVISIAQPEAKDAAASEGMLPLGESEVMYRGRATQTLVDKADPKPWETFQECPHEDFREPGRVHLDPIGNLHICQGVSMGNLFQTPLRKICETYDPDSHPMIGPLLRGGPAGLVRHFNLPHEARYADACHLCYHARILLRDQFPEILCPDQMYGVAEG
jgi:hypothetical protein